MKKLYQKTFEQALAQTYAPPEQVEAQRSALASRCSKPKSEVTAMTAKPRRPIRILVTAAVVAAALTAGALAASGVLSRITFHTGATIEYGARVPACVSQAAGQRQTASGSKVLPPPGTANGHPGPAFRFPPDTGRPAARSRC